MVASRPAYSQVNEPRVFLVTGATGAIGKAIARQLADIDNSRVVLVCRNQQKAERVINDIIQSSQNPNVCYILADISRHPEIKKLAAQWSGPLHVLINNAAVTPPTRQETPESIELQFATNVLGYFRLVNELSGILKASAPARVINVASYWAGGLDINDLEFKRRRYNNDKAYRQSKQANRMLSIAFADKLYPDITVNACHPGDVNSRLSNDLGFGGHETPDQGADTPVWLATDNVGREKTGCYFEHRREVTCPFSLDKQAVENLYNACVSYA
ncbi:MAG TPA: SDR family NAD(P)-dependent oxidoreductase [Crenotrichaceae bacterium]|nr:SDR family NAD(P)-dependent oxidoreductase [Crenotrichaceae bacterium]